LAKALVSSFRLFSAVLKHLKMPLPMTLMMPLPSPAAPGLNRHCRPETLSM